MTLNFLFCKIPSLFLFSYLLFFLLSFLHHSYLTPSYSLQLFHLFLFSCTKKYILFVIPPPGTSGRLVIPLVSPASCVAGQGATYCNTVLWNASSLLNFGRGSALTCSRRFVASWIKMSSLPSSGNIPSLLRGGDTVCGGLNFCHAV